MSDISRKADEGPSQAEPAGRLVVADDQEDLLDLMKDALEMQGYEVRTARNGQEAIDVVEADPPDVLILDLWMPIKDGFMVCKELKENPLYHHLPIILLSAASDRDNKIHGMELGADDFVTKPVDLMELMARIRMILRRTRQGLDANPLTRLPGNVSIQTRIATAIASRGPMAVLYLDLNNFKAYNDAYGYDAGDKVLKATAELLLKVGRRVGGSADFIGHIGGDDFIIVTAPDRMETLSQEIVRDFDALASTFYNERDRKRGMIVSKDRRGEIVEFPFLSIAIGVCHNKLRRISSYGQVSSIGAELKGVAKRMDGSAYFIDRRKD